MSTITLIIIAVAAVYLGYLAYAISKFVKKQRKLNDQTPLMEEYLRAVAELESKKAAESGADAARTNGSGEQTPHETPLPE